MPTENKDGFLFPPNPNYEWRMRFFLCALCVSGWWFFLFASHTLFFLFSFSPHHLEMRSLGCVNVWIRWGLLQAYRTLSQTASIVFTRRNESWINYLSRTLICERLNNSSVKWINRRRIFAFTLLKRIFNDLSSAFCYLVLRHSLSLVIHDSCNALHFKSKYTLLQIVLLSYQLVS